MKKSVRQFILFGLVGGLNTILSLVIYWVLVHFHVHYVVANTIGFIITVFISYVLNTLFTFQKEENNSPKWSLKTLAKVYVSYSFTGLFLSNILLYLFVDIAGINVQLAPIIGLLVTIPINFILNKFWAYKA